MVLHVGLKRPTYHMVCTGLASRVKPMLGRTLNPSLGGGLQAQSSLQTAPCHSSGPQFDAAICSSLQKNTGLGGGLNQNYLVLVIKE